MCMKANLLFKLAVKRSLAIVPCVLILLFGTVVLGSQDPFDNVQEHIADQRACFSQVPDGSMEEGANSKTGSCVDALAAHADGSIEQRLNAIREHLRSYEAEENNKSLIEEKGLQQDVGIPLIFNDAVESFLKVEVMA
jgi:hypothetical protein